MKNTFSLLPSKWVKVCSVFLMFFLVGLTGLQAQNYKPFDEAVQAVGDALEDITNAKLTKASVQSTDGNGTTTNAGASQSNTNQVKIFEASYFNMFLDQAKAAADVATAVEALDEFFSNQGQQSASRTAIMVAARADLMELITN
jgi:hypothetical protein